VSKHHFARRKRWQCPFCYTFSSSAWHGCHWQPSAVAARERNLPPHFRVGTSSSSSSLAMISTEVANG
jgi:hypothetical protein